MIKIQPEIYEEIQEHIYKSFKTAKHIDKKSIETPLPTKTKNLELNQNNMKEILKINGRKGGLKSALKRNLKGNIRLLLLKNLFDDIKLDELTLHLIKFYDKQVFNKSSNFSKYKDVFWEKLSSYNRDASNKIFYKYAKNLEQDVIDEYNKTLDKFVNKARLK